MVRYRIARPSERANDVLQIGTGPARTSGLATKAQLCTHTQIEWERSFFHYCSTFQPLELFQQTGNGVSQTMKHGHRYFECYILAVLQLQMQHD